MHHHLEIIMPPTDDVETAVTQILAPFDENLKDSDDENDDGFYRSSKPFWDWWHIGGCYSGKKMLTAIGFDRVDAFTAVLGEYKITVSGLQMGKPTLSPPEQADQVNRLWNEFFPDAPVKVCPLFDNYQGDEKDVMYLRDCPKNVEAASVIIAAASRDGKRVEAVHMVQDDIDNGVTFQKTTWDGTIGGALADWARVLGNRNPDYAAKVTPGDDWLVVTVDYHS